MKILNLHHEYHALHRYFLKHSYTSIPVDGDWYEAEMKALATLIAHDDRPNYVEYLLITDRYRFYHSTTWGVS
jgi:hypothetical protein